MKAFLYLLQHYLRLIYRDRNTKIYGVLLPLVLYPAVLFLALQGRLVLAGLAEDQESRVIIALQGEPDLALEIKRGTPKTLSSRLTFLPLPKDYTSARDLIQNQSAEAVITRGRPTQPLQIIYSKGDPGSKMAAERLKATLLHLQEKILTAAEIPLTPIPKLVMVDLAPAGSAVRNLLSRILPMILLIMTSMGALFPAVEVTAGEKERLTAETTLTLPLAQGKIWAARFCAVAVSALVAIGLNLTGMLLSAGSLFAGEAGAGLDLSFFTMAILLGCSIILVLFFSSCHLLVCALARNFREAQAFTTPVTSISFLPGMVAVFPQMQLNETTALIPLVNLALIMRSVLTSEVLPVPLALGMGEMLIISLFIFLGAERYLSRVDIALGRRPGSLSALLGAFKEES